MTDNSNTKHNYSGGFENAMAVVKRFDLSEPAVLLAMLQFLSSYVKDEARKVGKSIHTAEEMESIHNAQLGVAKYVVAEFNLTHPETIQLALQFLSSHVKKEARKNQQQVRPAGQL